MWKDGGDLPVVRMLRDVHTYRIESFQHLILERQT
jgi:hypothetical protein